MNYIYIIKVFSNDDLVARIPCPYVIDEFAKAYMQQFIKNHKITKDLPDGIYVVDLYKDIFLKSSEPELSNCFRMQDKSIEFIMDGPIV